MPTYNAGGKLPPEVQDNASNLLPDPNTGTHDPRRVKDLRDQAKANPEKWRKDAKRNKFKG